MNNTTSNIRVVSWNVSGAQNPEKRYKILPHIKSLNCDIGMLQESHLSDVQSMNMKQKWLGQVFSSPGTGESRGVRIFLAKNIPFKLSQNIIDKKGRYIIITGFLYNVKWTLINVYAPNTTQATFTTFLGSIITKAVEGPISCVGILTWYKTHW